VQVKTDQVDKSTCGPLTVADVRGRPTITVPEVGRLLGLGRAASYEAVTRGDIPSITIGRRKLIPVAKLLLMLGEAASTE